MGGAIAQTASVRQACTSFIGVLGGLALSLAELLNPQTATSGVVNVNLPDTCDQAGSSDTPLGYTAALSTLLGSVNGHVGPMEPFGALGTWSGTRKPSQFNPNYRGRSHAVVLL